MSLACGGTEQKNPRFTKEIDNVSNSFFLALVVLLKDPEPKVRSKAAEAMSLLHDF